MAINKKPKAVTDEEDNAEFDKLAAQVHDTSVPMKWEKAKIEKLNTGMKRIRQQKFLKAFAECGTLYQACEAADINKSTEKAWRASGDKWYIARFKEAQEKFRDSIGSIVKDRAIEGVEMPVFGKKLVMDAQGNPLGLEDAQVGVKRVYDSNLLMFYAKKVDPTFKEKYEEPNEVDTPSDASNAMTRITIQLNLMKERQNQQIIDITPIRQELPEDTDKSTE